VANIDENLKDHYEIPTILEGNPTFNLIFEIERGFWRATGKNMARSYITKNVYPGGFLFMPSDGGFWVTISRSQFIDLSTNSKPWGDCYYKFIEFSQPTSNTAVLFYNVSTTDSDGDFGTMMASTYHKSEDVKWTLLVSYQNVPFSPGIDAEALRKSFESN